MEKPVRSSFQYLSISYECALAIGNSLNLPEMLQEVIHIMVHKTNAHRGIIWVKNGEQELQPVANAGINIEDVLAQSEIIDLRGVLNQIQKRQQFVLRYKDDKDFLQYCPVLTGKEESVLIVPVTNVAILYLVYASREIADEPLANLLASLSKKLSVAIEACTAHENVIKEIQVREKAENELTKNTEQLISSEKELQGLYGESEQARKSLLSILEDVAQKEEALKESESKLNSILTSIDDLVFVFDQEDRFILIQKPTSEQLYTTSDEFIGKKPSEVMPSHLNKIFLDAFDKIKEGEVAEYDYWLKMEGKTLWYSAKHSPRFIDGELVGSVSIVRDITERKKAEERIIHYSRIFEESLNEIFLFKTDTLKFTQVNRAAQQNLGYTMEELQKMTPLDLKPKFTTESFAKLVAPLLKGETKKIVFETVHKRKDQSLYNVEIHLQLLKYEHEAFFAAIILDITERKKAEEALRLGEQNFRDLVENLMDGVAIADENAYHIYVNPKFSEITGYSRDELLNMTGWDFTPPEEIDKLKQRMKDRMAGKTVQTHYDRTIVKKDGTKIPVEMSSTVTIWQGKKRPLAIIHNLTKRKKAEEAIKESEQKYRNLFEYSPIPLWTQDYSEIIKHFDDLKQSGVSDFEEYFNKYPEELFKCAKMIKVKNVNNEAVKLFKAGSHEELMENIDDIFTKETMSVFKNSLLSIVERKKSFKSEVVLQTLENERLICILRWSGSGAKVIVSTQNITERKQAEEALKKSEYTLLKAQEIGSVGTWELDIKNNILNWTDEIYIILGIPLKTPPAYDLFINSIHPDDREYAKKEWAKGIKNNNYDIDYRLFVDGKLKWVREKAEITYDANGDPVKAIGFIQDITMRMDAELELQESQENITDLIKNSPDGIIITNADGKHIFTNNMMCEMLGYGYEELMEITIKEITSSEDLEKYKKMYDTRVRGEELPNLYERSIIKKDGSIIPVELRTATTVWAGEKCALTFITDITERKKVETALKESEHRLLRAQEVAHVGDWEFDVKTGVSVWSDEIYSIYGFGSADEIESETMLAGMHPDDLDYVNEKFAGWIKNGEGEPFEYRIVRPDGSIRHVYSPAEVVRDSNGNVVKVYGTALDITDRKNAEESLKIYAEELARSNEELKSLDKMKNDFLSNVSHELKTPLISIKGFSEVVQNELHGPLNDQQKKAMSTIIRNSERLGRLIDSILYLTVKKAGRDTYMFVPVNMSVIIDNAIIDISPQANSKELTIEQDIAPDLLLINGDIDKLAQVLTNLIENATKFTNNGGKITVKAYNEDENVHITVSDTGIGISNKVISNLFDKFYQVDASTTRRYGGTGIGLYISKLIVEVHKGKIWAESEEGIGTTFHIVLPK